MWQDIRSDGSAGEMTKLREEQVSADIDPNAGDWDGTIPGKALKGDPNRRRA